ncbi:uncharacterized protein LOC120112744 [Phoenix dactylifera]|uniref:Uncharacterized protein LOC120112744 n=1 Tax=Phoenix dactylifera TaxID=42345 RepID=A0A8B9AXA4_PHODC|nr:uncharacterized protein LOC120112744 [Phoenix dactylifera]
MAKKKATLTSRAWNLLRMALLWARKGGSLKRRLMADLHFIASHLKRLGAGDHPYGELHHGERELSFDETPTFRFKLRRPRFPCIQPPTKFDDNDDDDSSVFYKTGNPKSCSYFQNEMEEEDVTDHDEGGHDYDDDRSKRGAVHEDDDEEEEEIDSKAEDFIAKFYEQMKLQRQVSLLQYNEMLDRGMS